MTTSLYIDDATKKKASARAKKDKLSFSAVVRLLLVDYAEGRIEIGTRQKYVVEEIPVDKETQKLLDSAASKLRDIKPNASRPIAPNPKKGKQK